jgi:hypothetical protein
MAIGNLVVIWFIFPRFGILTKEKSGNPGYRCKNNKREFPFVYFLLLQVM